jgi:predicted nucleic acid-binding protein
MILVDTSVWISFFRGERRSAAIQGEIINGNVATHQYIIGELLLGGISSKIEQLLQSLDLLPVTDAGVVFQFIMNHHLHNRGIGWVDVNLIASSMISGSKIHTFDENLVRVCRSFGCLW